LCCKTVGLELIESWILGSPVRELMSWVGKSEKEVPSGYD
jgi:hypothetical protein